MDYEINTLASLRNFNRAYDRYVLKLDGPDNVSQLSVVFWYLVTIRYHIS